MVRSPETENAGILAQLPMQSDTAYYLQFSMSTLGTDDIPAYNEIH